MVIICSYFDQRKAVKDKIKEMEEKIDYYNTIIDTHFIPWKAAIISLNIIKKEDEDNFKKICQYVIKLMKKKKERLLL